MDNNIQWIATLIYLGIPISDIRDALVERKIEEHNIYLLIKAGQLLYQARIDLYGVIL